MTAEIKGFHGFGSTLEVSDANSPETFTPIAYLTKIKPGKLSTGAIDVTHLLSTDTHKERIPGIKDTAPFGFEGNYVPTTTTQKNASRGLIALWKARTVTNFQIRLSDGSPESTISFTGYISSLDIGDVKTDDKVAITGEITITAQPTLP